MHCARTICATICALSAAPASASNLLALTNPALIAEQRGVHFSGATFLGNDFSPIKEVHADLLNDYAPRGGRNLALITARVESGMDWQGLRVSALYRMEWLATVQRGTLDLYRTDRMLAAHKIGTTTSIDYRLDGFEARGLQLGKAWRFNQDSGWTIKLGASVNLLQGQKIRQEQWSGMALATAARTLRFSGEASRTWAMNSNADNLVNDFVPAYRLGDPGGRGYSLDLGMHVERQDGAFLDWTIADAFSRMYWTNIPQFTYSGSGVFNGAFPEGKKWRVDFADRLPVKQTLLLSLPIQPVHLELSDSVMQGQHFAAMGLRQEYAWGLSARLDYDFRFKTVGVGLAYRNFRIGLRSDAILPAQTHAFGLEAGITIDF